MAIKDFLADTWIYKDREDAQVHLMQVISWAQRSRLEPLVKLARSLKAHMEGIMGYYQNYTTSAAIEALNGKLQLAKRLARGYRNFENFRAIAYLISRQPPAELSIVNTTSAKLPTFFQKEPHENALDGKR